MSLFHKTQWYFNKALAVEFYSQSFGEIFKKKENELKNKSFDFLSFIHPEDLKLYKEELDTYYKALNSGDESLFLHNPYRVLVDERVIYLHEEKSLIKKGSDNSLISSVFYDCTDLYGLIIEKQNLINGCFEGTWEWSLDTDTVSFSARLLNSLGLFEQEVENNLKSWINLIHPDDRDTYLSNLESFIGNRGERSFSFGYQLKNKKGDWLKVLERAVVVEKNAKGQPKKVTSTVTFL